MDRQTLEFLIGLGQKMERIDFFNAAILRRLQTSREGKIMNLKWEHILNDAGEIQNVIEDIRNMATHIEQTLQEIYQSHPGEIPQNKMQQAECCAKIKKRIKV